MESDIRRLVVQAGLAAVNHGLFAEAQAIRAALVDLVPAPDLRRLLEATILIGLGELEEAAHLLENDASAEAGTLRLLLPEKRAGAVDPRAVHFAPLTRHTHSRKDIRHGH
ncbi:EscG/YscG/SsaH family type III secretion system needle protein co-chaperone [Trinickia symbiotica]|uniref:EscG/YscG/SsaH family type III secretion system needle protein co-chaperone n=1 Tax=Trinickia symbiotica TaxID=863227 RepID=A0A2T3XQ05_9BURK|nr:EscG/YscG/SsaH family type III secretion system needle protein co-chaperone [Trinickia symbiotica]PTB18605.1 EscG/YscG/SsaH family type III secretion system needle protein co-chaperone [Trinickia symbiotica]